MQAYVPLHGETVSELRLIARFNTAVMVQQYTTLDSGVQLGADGSATTLHTAITITEEGKSTDSFLIRNMIIANCWVVSGCVVCSRLKTTLWSQCDNARYTATQKYLSNNYCLAHCQIVPVQMQTHTKFVLWKMGDNVYFCLHFNQQKLQPSKCYGWTPHMLQSTQLIHHIICRECQYPLEPISVLSNGTRTFSDTPHIACISEGTLIVLW